jgi:hypothetical protein
MGAGPPLGVLGSRREALDPGKNGDQRSRSRRQRQQVMEPVRVSVAVIVVDPILEVRVEDPGRFIVARCRVGGVGGRMKSWRHRQDDNGDQSSDATRSLPGARMHGRKN